MFMIELRGGGETRESGNTQEDMIVSSNCIFLYIIRFHLTSNK